MFFGRIGHLLKCHFVFKRRSWAKGEGCCFWARFISWCGSPIRPHLYKIPWASSQFAAFQRCHRVTKAQRHGLSLKHVVRADQFLFALLRLVQGTVFYIHQRLHWRLPSKSEVFCSSLSGTEYEKKALSLQAAEEESRVSRSSSEGSKEKRMFIGQKRIMRQGVSSSCDLNILGLPYWGVTKSSSPNFI